MGSTVVDGLLIALAAVLVVPVLVFCAECWLALLPRFRATSIPGVDGPRPRVAVLIPAHNEELVIEATLDRLLPQLGVEDVVVVVADNCTDRTAELVRAKGAVAVERQDPSRRGKGFALEYGMRELEAYEPEAVIVLDADCELSPGSVETLGRAATALGRPVQALNLCDCGPDAGPLQMMSAFAMYFKNLIRPLGLSQLHLPCPLMGTGFALPWSLARNATWAGNHLVEDMQMGLDLAVAGHPTRFLPAARVSSRVPQQVSAFVSQRTRWEQGHLRTTFAQAPRLTAAAVRTGRPSLLALALDLSVPPFSFLMLCLGAAWLAATFAGLMGSSWLPALMLTMAVAATAATVLAGWLVFCRRTFPMRVLLASPWYIVRKLPIYLGFFLRCQSEWVRTERDASGTATAAPR